MNIRKLAVTLVMLTPLAIAGCKSESPSTAKASPVAPAKAEANAPSGGVAIDQAARDEAQEIFSSRCTVCHGPAGAGDGPASAGLTPKPASFASPDWQASVTDDHIEKIIKYGGGAVGRSPMMPGNPDLSSKDATVAALREHIRTLKK